MLQELLLGWVLDLAVELLQGRYLLHGELFVHLDLFFVLHFDFGEVVEDLGRALLVGTLGEVEIAYEKVF